MNELVLFDSRARAQTGRRTAHTFPATQDGMRAAWLVCLRDEVPDDVEGYLGFSLLENVAYPIAEVCETFNSFWAEYGWALCEFDPDWVVPDDVDLREEEPSS